MTDIAAYEKFITPELLAYLNETATPIVEIPGLTQLGERGGLETIPALEFLISLYSRLHQPLSALLEQREKDRAFIDQRTLACQVLNRDLKLDLLDPEYHTVLGHEDGDGRVVMGPLTDRYAKGGANQPVAKIPAFLEGAHVTLFGPPDDPKLSINAMNAFHRRLKNEPPIVSSLLDKLQHSPFWGADDEDSKTPLRKDLVSAGNNLTGCFDKTISFNDAASGKTYQLEDNHLSLPIKRFPGLALPSFFLFYNGNPIPLHLYDFGLHLFRHWNRAEALSFYVPKLENEEEANYIHLMVATAEQLLIEKFPAYKQGTIRLFIVLENPRAIFRIHEIIDALFPYFAGASLGWHDFLSSTARIFKNDSNYRIPVKADPDIVIKYIKASHHILAETVGSRGGIKIGGMYGILPMDTDPSSPSFQITLRGFIKDVVTQMKRNLTGYWVAHPDFVRIGLALVEAWKHHAKGNTSPLEQIVRSLIHSKAEQTQLLAFINGPDVSGLDPTSPLYPRSLIVADIKESTFIANNHPDEIRFNVFQSLQYLTDWLSGNGCVALPAEIDGVPVRVMDDLATAERSRWEVWHELHHGRFPMEHFISIVHEEMRFIQKDLSDSNKIVQVKWDARTDKWYPIAHKIMLLLMTSPNSVEFASELLLPFTIEAIRNSPDPWSAIQKLSPDKYKFVPYVDRMESAFTVCGSKRFAKNINEPENVVKSFTLDEAKEAAFFHGDIGENAKTLDPLAKQEQAAALASSTPIQSELQKLAKAYLDKFGIKFLVSAQGKSAADLLAILKIRINNSAEAELANARSALWEITKKRLFNSPENQFSAQLDILRQKHHVKGVSIAISKGKDSLQPFVSGTATQTAPVTTHTLFEIASLSKSIASCFAIETLAKLNIPIDSSVNALLTKTKSPFRITSLDPKHPEWADEVTVTHLLNHTAMNMHYVNGFPPTEILPSTLDLIKGNSKWGYETVGVLNKPGIIFKYSGGGFLVLQHLLESLLGTSIGDATQPFLNSLELKDFSFTGKNSKNQPIASGFLANGSEIPGSRKIFPAFAAGALSNSTDVSRFLSVLTEAFHHPMGFGPISHDTAVRMLYGIDVGSNEFMGAKMGLGIFVADAGPNRLAIHQGANDGYRALFVHCVYGPDTGKGFTILCNGDENGVGFVAEIGQLILKDLALEGVNVAHFQSERASKGGPAYETVNQGYKELIFNSFEPDLPPEILVHGPLDPLSPFNIAVDAAVISVSNQKFALAKNLISPYLPHFDPGLYDRQGKVMDSWETVRHNPKSYDELILKLKESSNIQAVSVSTQFHHGNHAEFIQLETKSTLEGAWEPLLLKTPLLGHAQLQIALAAPKRGTYLRVMMFPDGGLTRLGLFDDRLPKSERAHFESPDKAKCHPFLDEIPKSKRPLAPRYLASPAAIIANWEKVAKGAEVDLASAAFGGRILSASNEHYSPASQAISPFPPLHMFDGFESARSREKVHFEEMVISLAKEGIIHRIEVDFSYFRNNNPRELRISGNTAKGWVVLLEKTKVKAYAGNVLCVPVSLREPCREIKVTVFPDGGINRVRVYSYY